MKNIIQSEDATGPVRVKKKQRAGRWSLKSQLTGQGSGTRVGGLKAQQYLMQHNARKYAVLISFCRVRQGFNGNRCMRMSQVHFGLAVVCLSRCSPIDLCEGDRRDHHR